jgi:hypothetical protein
MSVLFSEQGSATSDLTMTTADPLMGLRLLQEGIPRDEFTFIINHKAFPTSAIEAMALSPALGEQLQVDARRRRFIICDREIDSANFFLFKTSFQGWKLFSKARIRNHSFDSAGNIVTLALSNFLMQL